MRPDQGDKHGEGGVLKSRERDGPWSRNAPWEHREDN